jgi:hypothetical protein
MEKIKGVKVPKGFKRWMVKRLKEKGIENPYAFVNWSLNHHWKKETIRKWVNKFKRSKK